MRPGVPTTISAPVSKKRCTSCAGLELGDETSRRGGANEFLSVDASQTKQTALGVISTISTILRDSVSKQLGLSVRQAAARGKEQQHWEEEQALG